MKAEYDCIPCIMKQALNTATRATEDDKIIREILTTTSDYVKTIDLDKTPADLSNFVYRLTRKVSGVDDPYRDEKRRHNDLCLSLLDGIQEKIANTDDPLYASIKASVFGNMIDLGIGHKFDIEEDIKNALNRIFAVDDYPLLRSVLSNKKKILYIGDNTGEIVFDIPFIEA